MSQAISKCPVSILVPTRNEERNLQRCLNAIANWADEIVVVDSQSTDRTLPIASAFQATVVQFHYKGGWPKKRNWALENHAWKNDWILLLDADEIVPEPLKMEIAETIPRTHCNGFLLKYQIHFLGRRLHFGGTQLRKLALIRRGHGRYERRLQQQDSSMGDMEVHEHVVVDGLVGTLHCPIQHENVNCLDRYIAKHNEYSNWEARVLLGGLKGEILPSLLGSQAQRRRWLKRRFLGLPGSPVALFFLKYLFQLGFLDGIPGLIYCAFQAFYIFEVKAKAYEQRFLRPAE
jgi:glycosyltransferase involved in cell wall biosynthesis